MELMKLIDGGLVFSPTSSCGGFIHYIFRHMIIDLQLTLDFIKMFIKRNFSKFISGIEIAFTSFILLFLLKSKKKLF